MKCISGLLLVLCSGFILSAQQKKSVEAISIASPLIIDGVLDEEYYNVSQPAKDFVQLQPSNGQPSFQASKVHFFYDQNALYVGAMLYDESPDSIFNYLSERDHIGMSDYFGVYIDPYNEGQLAYGFFVTPAGVQTDIKAIKQDYDYEDGSWDAVWESKTRITDEGWIVEMRIPYAMLRFPDKEEHTWGLNMFRNIRRYNSNNSWSLVDRKVSGFIHQEGEMTGIKDIKPPVRLSLSPYAAGYMEYQEGATTPEYIFKGGVDLKYGISESFTLDMMLVPDFGQIQSDDKQLNLSPYELYHDEKRQFFNEGTELFDRAGIFYSRRIGGTPKFIDKAEDALKDNEEVDYNPRETQLLNATKISGRTEKGWGMGVLNAMSMASYATLKDTLTEAKRDVQTQPFTNYNIMVMDKTLKNNSYVSLINSNVSMYDNAFMADVVATDFQIRDKSKKYAIKGKAGMSSRGDEDKDNGFYAYLSLAKNQGKWQYSISQMINDDKFNINDLGYISRNNELRTHVYGSYRIVEPYWKFREWYAETWWNYNRIYNPSDVFGHEIGGYSYVMFMNNYGFDINGGFQSMRRDYYEPRVKGRYYEKPYNIWYNASMHTDRRKNLNGYFHFGGFQKPLNDQYGHWEYTGFDLRIGQHVQIGYDIGLETEFNDRGFVDMTDSEDTIYFGRRDLRTIENVWGISYAINNSMSIRMRTRHYWSSAAYKSFYQLLQNGTLQDDTEYSHEDDNLNAFNIDMVFRWIFAPGSELSIAWKNDIFEEGDIVNTDYFRNLDNTWNSDQTNSISLKILYYLDYNKLRRKG